MIEPHKHKQLFLDDGSVEELSNVSRRLHQPKKCGPVLRPDPSRGQFFVETRNVPQWNPERGLWEWWYFAAYRVPPYGPRQSTTWYQYHLGASPDGERWDTSPLGLYEWQGSADNNVVYDPRDRRQRTYHVIRDEDDPDPARRYKGMFTPMYDPETEPEEKTFFRFPGYSADGLHWTTFSDHAGAVIEYLAGRRLSEVMERLVFRPLGLKRTTLWAGAMSASYLNALPSGDRGANGQDEAPHRNIVPAACGMLYTTASEFLEIQKLFADGGRHHGERLFDERLFESMMHSGTKTHQADGKAYSLCNMLLPNGGSRFPDAGFTPVYHTGTLGGWKSHAGFIGEPVGLVWSYVSNCSADAFNEDLFDFLVRQAREALVTGGCRA